MLHVVAVPSGFFCEKSGLFLLKYGTYSEKSGLFLLKCGTYSEKSGLFLMKGGTYSEKSGTCMKQQKEMLQKRVCNISRVYNTTSSKIGVQ